MIKIGHLLLGVSFISLGCVQAFAQQASQGAAPPIGSPAATITIPGNQIPPPDPKFGGVIKEKASESTPWWAPRVVPPIGAPNVLLIMPGMRHKARAKKMQE